MWKTQFFSESKKTTLEFNKCCIEDLTTGENYTVPLFVRDGVSKKKCVHITIVFFLTLEMCGSVGQYICLLSGLTMKVASYICLLSGLTMKVASYICLLSGLMAKLTFSVTRSKMVKVLRNELVSDQGGLETINLNTVSVTL